MPVRLGVALVAEFIGTFALCFVGVLSIQHAQGVPGGLILVALAHGLVLSTMITATLPTSGGHFNPAVTLGFLMTGKIKPVAAIGYIVIQLIAGLFAALTIYLIFGGTPEAAAVVFRGTPDLGLGVGPATALLAEIIATFFLVFAIWGTAADPRARNVGGFGIGLTLSAAILCVGPICGASLNPARSFGPTVIGAWAPGGEALWNHHWIYWLGPIVGGGLAALIYHLVLWPRDPRRGIDPGAVDVPPAQRPA